MTTDHTAPRALARARAKRKAEGPPPNNTWWVMALASVTGMVDFAANLAVGETARAAVAGLIALWSGQRAWLAWPHYRDGARPVAIPNRLIASVFGAMAIAMALGAAGNLFLAFAKGSWIYAAHAAFFTALALSSGDDARLAWPGAWLKGRRRDRRP